MADNETPATETVEIQDPPSELPGTNDPPTPPAAPAGDVAAQLAELQASNARLQAALKDRNAEEAARRKKLAALEKAQEEAELATKSETEKLQAKLTKLETEAAELRAFKQRTLARDRILIGAEDAKVEFASIRARDTAIELLLKQVTIGDDGEVEGVEDALKALVKEHDYLLKKEAAATSAQPQPAVKINAAERGADGKPVMSDVERREKAARLGVKEKYARQTQ
jgi:hypothetical protein